MHHRKLLWILVGTFVLASVGTPAFAQSNRSSWMWTSSSHPYGAGNVIGDIVKERDVIRDFKFWGFDRIYASLGSWPVTDPSRIAHWNAGLDDAGIQSQMLLGEPTWLLPATRPGLLNIIQTKLIDYNASRTDARELIDGVHLDIEPHQLSLWGTGTNADRRDLLLSLGDTYAEVRALLDTSGQSQVKIYADLPVWFDSSSSIGWAAGQRDQWFSDIGNSLEGISMMAYERGTLSHINNGVQWEINNFNGEVRVGLESNSNGPGKTWPTFQAMLDMADALDAYHGSDIGGIDFHPLNSFADLSEHAPVISGDLDGDGFVGVLDLNIVLANWNLSLPIADPRADASGDLFIGIADLGYVLGGWNKGTPPAEGSAVPEPASLMFLGLGGALIASRGSSRNTPFRA
jgi:PEP-CTERM motif-containing protein